MRKIFLTFIVLTFLHIVFAQNKQTVVVRPETNLEKTMREAEATTGFFNALGEWAEQLGAERLNMVKNSRYSVFVEEKLEEWKKKGAFEKTANWQKRLDDSTAIKQAEIYESALDEFVQMLKVLNYDNISLNGFFYNSEGQYDPDKEVLVVNTFWGNIPIQIPLDEAKNMKLDFRSLGGTYDNPLGFRPRFFIHNDQLALVSLTFPCQGKYTWVNPSQSAQIARNKRLELEQIARNKRLELKRLDSLELATYNQKLDSILKNHNRKLLQNPYNISQQVLTNNYKITEEDTERESNFNKSISLMKSNFESLNNRFSEIYESDYQRNKQYFASKDEFDALYKQGIDIYSEGIELLNFLARYGYSILDMDFQNPYFDTNKKIFSIIKDSQGKPYYPQVIDLVIKYNKKLNIEWSDKGKFFDNKAEFYNAYLSDDYEKILKANKKALKANKKK